MGANGHANNEGKAYVYALRSGKWAETDISPSDGAVSDGFGSSIAVSSDGTTVAVGANGKNSNQGQAYVYH